MGYVASFCLCVVLTYRLLHELFLITTVELREIHCLYKYCFTERNNRDGLKLRRFVSLSITTITLLWIFFSSWFNLYAVLCIFSRKCINIAVHYIEKFTLKIHHSVTKKLCHHDAQSSQIAPLCRVCLTLLYSHRLFKECCIVCGNCISTNSFRNLIPDDRIKRDNVPKQPFLLTFERGLS